MRYLAKTAIFGITLDEMACDADTVLRVIAHIYEGKSLSEAFRLENTRSEAFFKFKDSVPHLAESYAHAQRARAELMVEEIIDISDNELDANRARVRVDARKWYASKMQPQKYGDRIDVNLNATVDIVAALAAAKARVIPSSYPDITLDAQPAVITLPLLNETSGLAPVDTPCEVADEIKPIDLFS